MFSVIVQRFLKLPLRVAAFVFFLSLVIAALLFASPYYVLFVVPPGQIRQWYPNYGGYWLWVRFLIPFLLVGGSFFPVYSLWHGRGYILNQIRTRLFAKMNPLIVGVTIALITAGACEGVLRYNGYVPGRYINDLNREVDSVMVLEGTENDSSGIFKISRVGRDRVAEEIEQGVTSGTFQMRYAQNEYGEVTELARDYLDVISGKHKNEFGNYLLSISEKEKLNEFDSVLLRYSRSPINQSGFRSIPFEVLNEKRPRVLLLGDSYCWGHTTVNKTNSFYDILLSRGYTIYNTGIGATDPPQYLGIARQLVPKLQPDLVIVNFNLGSDVQYFERKLSAQLPVVWHTNAGDLFPYWDGVYFKNLADAYRFGIEFTFIPNTTLFNKACRSTVITTLLWSALSKVFGFMMDTKPDSLVEMEKRIDAFPKPAVPYSDLQVKEIEKMPTKRGRVCSCYHTWHLGGRINKHKNLCE